VLDTGWVLLPRRLPDDAVLRVIAPASPLDEPELLEAAERWFATHGVRLTTSEDARRAGAWHAGTAEARAADLMTALSDPEVDGVIALRGGHGCAELLPHLDPAALRQDPKPLIGFSDVTALHAWAQQAGVVSFYGPTVFRFAHEADQLTAQRLLDVLRGDGTGPVPWQPSDRTPTSLVAGTASGPLRGGWLTGLVHLLGTRWEPDLAGAVVLLEEVSQPPQAVDRMLLHLQLAGKLDGVAGFVVGELADCAPEDHPEARQGRTPADVVEQRLSPYGVPVLYDVPIGHGTSLATVPLGAEVAIDGTQLVVTEPALEQ